MVTQSCHLVALSATLLSSLWTANTTEIKLLKNKPSQANCLLQIEEEVAQLHVGLLADALAHEESQFVGILAPLNHSDYPLWQEIQNHTRDTLRETHTCQL